MFTNKNGRLATTAAVAIFVVVLVSPVARAAAQETILLNYSGKNGANPGVTMVTDKAGNLYGTTNFGGAYSSSCNGAGCGTVFELVYRGGTYSYKTIHSFGNGSDGQLPNAQLTVDSQGNLFGDTISGGTNGAGTVFKLHRNAIGTWTETVIYNFTGGKDGSQPMATLAFDTAGNLYGTASGGGIVSSACTNPYVVGCGTVFKLAPRSIGQWAETTIHQFTGAPDGFFPLAGLVVAANGVLYGTTDGGGVYGFGTVYSLKRGLVWSESILHNFNEDGTDGTFPVVGLTADTAGNLYGPAINGGSTLSGCGGVGCGVIFELLAPTWTEKILYSFTGGNDGGGPATNLIFDGSGNLYSTDFWGGTSGTGCGGLGCGVVFELKPNGTGGWSESTLHNFGLGSDGSVPEGGVIFGADGNLYGTTNQGGTNNLGVVYKLVP